MRLKQGRAIATAMALLSCGVGCTHRAPGVRCRDRVPEGSDVTLVAEGEAGEPFVLSGRVLSRARRPVGGITVLAYHADARGLYAPDARAEPRLCGVLRTAPDGTFRIRTIMPGSYGGPPHVHLEVWGPGVSRQFAVVNLIRRPDLDTLPRPTAPAVRMPSGFAPEEGAGAMRSVTRAADGLLHATCEILIDAAATDRR